MGETSAAASGASNAASAAGNTTSGLSTALSSGSNAASAFNSGVSAVQSAAPAASSAVSSAAPAVSSAVPAYSVDSLSSSSLSNAAPTSSGYSLGTPQMSAPMDTSISGASTAGTEATSGGLGEWLTRFGKGMDQTAGEAWKNKGWNPETYGYLYGKLSNLVPSSGGSVSSGDVNTYVNYQQPENDYLKRKYSTRY